jgi:hypothetical protein
LDFRVISPLAAFSYFATGLEYLEVTRIFEVISPLITCGLMLVWQKALKYKWKTGDDEQLFGGLLIKARLLV